jgi:hypothetical protein
MKNEERRKTEKRRKIKKVEWPDWAGPLGFPLLGGNRARSQSFVSHRVLPDRDSLGLIALDFTQRCFAWRTRTPCGVPFARSEWKLLFKPSRWSFFLTNNCGGTKKDRITRTLLSAGFHGLRPFGVPCFLLLAATRVRVCSAVLQASFV